MPDVKALIDRRNKLKEARRTWEQTWQELAEVLTPSRADFITESSTDGERRTDKIFDSTPRQACRSLAAGIDSFLMPRNVQWFHARPRFADLLSLENVRLWSETVEQRMFNAFYARTARFGQRTGEVLRDLVTFGTGVLFIGETADAQGLLFRSFHLRDTLIAENEEGVVDTIFIDMKLTARQAMQRYGEDSLSQEVREAETKHPDRTFKFLWVVQPRRDGQVGKAGPRNMPFASFVIEVEDKRLVRESGYEEFPFAVVRWDTSSGELYGRGPGHVALPDASVLQAMGKTLLVAGQRAVDPPMWAISDGILSAPRTYPGGMTYFDGEAARRFGRPPLGELSTQAQIPLGREMQNDTREQVWGAFFRNVLQLPVNAPRMTATEVIERKEEMLRAVGPVFGQLETDFLAATVERAFGIMLRAGAFPPPPLELQGKDLDFRFESPILRAKNQIEMAGLARTLEMLLPLVQAQPDMIDNFEGDAIARAAPYAGGFPTAWLKSTDVRDAGRQARAAAAEAQQAAQLAQQGARALRDAAPVLMPQEEAPVG